MIREIEMHCTEPVVKCSIFNIDNTAITAAESGEQSVVIVAR